MKRKSGRAARSTPVAAEQNGGTQESPASLPKIATKSLIGKVAFEKDDEEGKELPLFTVFGVLTGSRSGEGERGEWTALHGKFGAIRASDGEEFASSRAYLPVAVTAHAVAALAELAAKNPEGKPELRFAYKLIAVKDSKQAVGYSYQTEVLIQGANDPLALLRAEIAAI